MKTRLEPNFEDAYRSWQKTPDKQTMTNLLSTVQPVLDTAVKTYGGPKPSPTLQTRARVLAAEAIPTYDPQRGPLKTHLMSQLQRLRRHSAKGYQSVRMPEAAALQRHQLADAEKQLQQQLGRLPSVVELSDATGLSRKRIASLREAIVPVAAGTLQQTRYDTTPYDPSVKRKDAVPMWMELAFEDMTPRDQFIVERALGMHGIPPASATDIARQLGVSSAAISQRINKLQAVLDQWEDAYA